MGYHEEIYQWAARAAYEAERAYLEGMLKVKVAGIPPWHELKDEDQGVYLRAAEYVYLNDETTLRALHAVIATGKRAIGWRSSSFSAPERLDPIVGGYDSLSAEHGYRLDVVKSTLRGLLFSSIRVRQQVESEQKQRDLLRREAERQKEKEKQAAEGR